MAYLTNNSSDLVHSAPKCAVVPTNAQSTLGDFPANFSKFAQALGTTPGTLLVVGGAGIFAGWMLNELVSGIGNRVRKARRSFRRKRKQASGALGGAIAHSTPTWQTLVLAGVAAGAVWIIATRVMNQKGAQG
jgi:hypothetical protein